MIKQDRQPSTTMTTKYHFILVHGAWHQPDHWTALVNLLHSSGHSTYTPKLPSASASPPPNVFNEDIAAIKEAISEAAAQGATSIIPVLHSYGGIPGFEALATLTPEEKARILRVVCISAFIVPKGGSLAGAQQRDDSQYVRKDVRMPGVLCKFLTIAIRTNHRDLVRDRC